MEKTMEKTVRVTQGLYRDYIGIMGKKMETNIYMYISRVMRT